MASVADGPFAPKSNSSPANELPSFEDCRQPVSNGSQLLPAPRSDSQVVKAAAAASTPTTPATAILEIQEADPPAAATGPPASPMIITRALDKPVLLRSGRFTVKLNAADSNATVVASPGNVPATKDATNTLFTFDLSSTVKATNRQQTITLQSNSSGTAVKPAAGTTQISVIVPLSDGLATPQITKASNSKSIDPGPVQSPPLTVYGKYLRVVGQDGPPTADQLSFYIYQFDGTDYIFKSIVIGADTSIDLEVRTWSATLQLPEDLS